MEVKVRMPASDVSFFRKLAEQQGLLLGEWISFVGHYYAQEVSK